jgi:hypothetical protein
MTSAESATTVLSPSQPDYIVATIALFNAIWPDLEWDEVDAYTRRECQRIAKATVHAAVGTIK